MFQFFKEKRGFTLIEVLIAVAIIGILSAFISASLWKARPKARLARVQTQMNSLYPYLVTCANDGDVVDFRSTGDGGATGLVPVVGDKICDHANEGSVFPTVPSSWNYVNSSMEGAIKAETAEGDAWSVECSETGCVTTIPAP